MARARVCACVCTPQYMNAVALHPPVTVRRCLAETHANMPPKIIYMKDNPNAARLHVHRQTDRQTWYESGTNTRKTEHAKEGDTSKRKRETARGNTHALCLAILAQPLQSDT